MRRKQRRKSVFCYKIRIIKEFLNIEELEKLPRNEEIMEKEFNLKDFAEDFNLKDFPRII